MGYEAQKVQQLPKIGTIAGSNTGYEARYEAGNEAVRRLVEPVPLVP